MPLDDPSLYQNRELSLLEFNRRVLAQAADPSVPLLERLRFLTISCTNLDEFFEVRVAGLVEQVEAKVATPSGPDGLTPEEVLRRIRGGVEALVAEQYRILMDVLLPTLASEGIVVLKRGDWNPAQRAFCQSFFENEVQPVLTPIALDPAHPFPAVLNKVLTFVVKLEGDDAFGRDAAIAVVQAPRTVQRLIPVPDPIGGAPHTFVLLSSVIHEFVGDLFPGMTVTGCHPFRVTRNSNLWVDEEEVEDLLAAIRGELRRRHYGEEVRVEVPASCPADIARFVLDEFELPESSLYRVPGPVNPFRLQAICDIERPELKFAPFRAALAREHHGSELFETIRRGDVVLHHPYDAFTPVIDFLRSAAKDPGVVAIKATLYRTGPRSEFAEALVDAARAGKEVTAVIELRARFDEAANVDLATRLQEAAVNVVYGVVGYKTHAKMMLIVRREATGLRRYVHLGTGNYHSTTAKLYTDISLLSADRVLGEDVHRLFQQLTGLGKAPSLQRLVAAPFRLREVLIERIDAQAELARSGLPCRIVAKMNALAEPSIIQALYRASQAGVPIDLLIRGFCTLRPGVPGVSETIRVVSILGRFLEHARIWAFGAELDEVWCSSADWRPRNLFRRVEVAFPLTDPVARARVVEECITLPLSGRFAAWTLDSEGRGTRSPEVGGVSLHEHLIRLRVGAPPEPSATDDDLPDTDT